MDKSPSTPPRRRVLHVTSGYQRYPNDRQYLHDFVVETVRRMAKDFEMHVLAPRDHGNQRVETIDGVTIHRHDQSPFNLVGIAYGSGALPNLRAQPWKIAFVPFYVLYLTIQAAWIIWRYRIDVVQLHWLIPHGLPLVLLKLIFFPKLQLVGTAYGADILQDDFSVGGKLFNFIIRFIARNCDVVTTTSHFNKKVLQQVSGIKDIHVIRVGVDTDYFEPSRRSSKQQSALGVQGTSCLFVGSLIERKGIDALVRAVPVILRQISDFNLYVVGDGYHRKALEAVVQADGTRASVHFLGYVDQATKADLFANCDFFCLPSRSEGFGIVNTEAMASGAIPVVTPLEVFTEVVQDGRTGFVLRNDQPEEFAAVFMRAKRDAPPGAPMRQLVRQRVLDEFSWSTVISRYSQLINLRLN